MGRKDGSSQGKLEAATVTFFTNVIIWAGWFRKNTAFNFKK